MQSGLLITKTITMEIFSIQNIESLENVHERKEKMVKVTKGISTPIRLDFRLGGRNQEGVTFNVGRVIPLSTAQIWERFGLQWEDIEVYWKEIKVVVDNNTFIVYQAIF
jgi:hypothetical protein